MQRVTTPDGDPAYIVHIDGAARGNPGPAACAFVIARGGATVRESAERMGTASNNVAEYTALVRALTALVGLGAARVEMFSDSELLVKQMSGEYRVKNEDLKPLYEQAQGLARKLTSLTLRHVRREQNKRADELCNLALDGKPVTATAPAASAPAKKSAESANPARGRVESQALECLAAAAGAWSRGDAANPPVALVWDQLWDILDEAGVLKRPRSGRSG